MLLKYPIPELGYCRDAKECYFYCEIPQNKASCWSYGKFKLGPQVLGVSTPSEEEKKMMETKARQLGITFPIAELGNCAGPAECRSYCEEPAHQSACMNFAKKYGLSREAEMKAKSDEMLEKAQTELGCNSMETCRQICEADHSRCEAFARKHGFSRPEPRQMEQNKEQMLERARIELGCNSMESCARVCEQNREKCMEFAKRHGMYQEERREEYRYESRTGVSGGLPAGRQGCDSEESCRRYCQEHPAECPGYQEFPSPAGGANLPSPAYVGPSGCRTQAECEAYCRNDPSRCPGFSEAQSQHERPTMPISPIPTYYQQSPTIPSPTPLPQP